MRPEVPFHICQQAWSLITGRLDEEGETSNALKKPDDMRTGMEPTLPHAPLLQRGSGDMQHLGSLTLGDPLGLQVVILVKQFSASAPIPALLALYIATLLVMDYSAHNYLLYRSPCRARSGGLRMAR